MKKFKRHESTRSLKRERLCSWGIAASLAGPIIGGLLGAGGAQSAASTQADAANQAANNQMMMFQQQQKNLQPWMQSGGTALQALMEGLGLATPTAGQPSAGTGVGAPSAAPTATGGGYQWRGQTFPDYLSLQNGIKSYLDGLGYDGPDVQRQMGIELSNVTPISAPAAGTVATGAPGTTNALGTSGIQPGGLTQPFSATAFQADPGYNWMLQQGLGAVSNRATTGAGGGTGGNLDKSLINYATGAASQEYNNAYQRYLQQQQQQYNMLAGVSGTGVNAAGVTAGLGMGAANTASNYATSGAASTAAGTVGAANALTGGIAGGYNNMLIQQILAQNQQRIDQGGIYPNQLNATGAPYESIYP